MPSVRDSRLPGPSIGARSGAWSLRAAGLVAAVLAMLAACAGLAVPERSRFVDGPAGKLHVVHAGAGTSGLPVLFVHAFGGNASHWDAQVEHLRAGRRVVAFDLRGHGQSDAATAQTGYLIEPLAGDVAAVADALGLQRFVLVGHSLGAAVAAAYAARHPQRVAGLVLVGAAGRTPAEQSVPMMQALRADYAAASANQWRHLLQDVGPENAGRIRRELERVPRETALALIGALLSYDPNAALQAYGGPVLIVDTPHGDGPQALHRQSPAVPRRLITGTSHWPHLDRPAEFSRVLDGFLAGLR